MKYTKLIYKYSGKINSLNRQLNAKSTSSSSNTLQNISNNDSQNDIVKRTDTTIIYKNQPENDTLNMKDISITNPNFRVSRKSEQLRFKISGEESQVAIVDIYPGERVRSESHKIIFMSEGVLMKTTAGGVSSMFKRVLGGSSMFVTDYSYEESFGYGRVAFAEDTPSKIIPIRLDDYGGQIICKKGSFICGTSDVDIAISFSKKLSTGFFGGEGFVMQQISQQKPGQTVLLRAGGSIIKRRLREGEKLRVSPGLIVALEQSVKYDIEAIQMNKSILNYFGGARSLFQATFVGPGDIYLQSISFNDMVNVVAKIYNTKMRWKSLWNTAFALAIKLLQQYQKK